MAKIGELDSAKVTVLLDDYAGYESRFLAQHGISILLEAVYEGKQYRILLDVGQSAYPILHNMELMGISPSSIDAIVLSHCHYDHTGGLVEFLKAAGKRDFPIVAHPDIFRENYAFRPIIQNIGVSQDNSREAVEEAGGRMCLVWEPLEIMPGVMVTGEVPRRRDFEKPGIGTWNVKDGKVTPDEIVDDISIVVKVKDTTVSPSAFTYVLPSGFCCLFSIKKYSSSVIFNLYNLGVISSSAIGKVSSRLSMEVSISTRLSSQHR